MQKNKFPPGFAVMAVGLSGILFMTGCAKEYDVLDKISDSTTVGESISSKISYMIENRSSSVDYICKRAYQALSDDVEVEEDERPEYNAEDYVDTSKADITKLKASKVTVSDSEVEDYIKAMMRNSNIYAETAEEIESDCIAHVAYNKIDSDTQESVQSLSNVEWHNGSDFFPEDVDKALIGHKVGDKVTVESDGCEYEITINDISRIEINNKTVFTITSGLYSKVDKYKEYIKNYLYNQKLLEADEKAIEKLCDETTVKSYPSDVLAYDIQNQYLYYYQLTGTSSPDDEAFKTYMKEELGCNDEDELMEKIKKDVKENLDDEMKIFALAKKYNLWLDDDELANEILQNTTEYSSAEDYYAAYSKSYARYFISKLNLAKEIQKNEERIEGAG